LKLLYFFIKRNITLIPLRDIFSEFNLGAKVTTLPNPGIIFRMHPWDPDLLGRPQSLAV